MLGASNAKNCEAWCTESCRDLNGALELECGGCPDSEQFQCRPGAPGFPGRAGATRKTINVDDVSAATADPDDDENDDDEYSPDYNGGGDDDDEHAAEGSSAPPDPNMEDNSYDPSFHPGVAFKYSPALETGRDVRFKKRGQQCDETLTCYRAAPNPNGWLMNPHWNSTAVRVPNVFDEATLDEINTTATELRWNEPGYKPKIGKRGKGREETPRSSVRMNGGMMEQTDLGCQVIDRLAEVAIDVDRRHGWGLLDGKFAATREGREALAQESRFQIAHHTYPAGAGLLNLQHYDEGALVTIILMISESAEYDGGETVMAEEDATEEGATRWAMERADVLVFPGHRYHGVGLVTRGVRRVVIMEISDEMPGDESAKAMAKIPWIHESTKGLRRYTIPPMDELLWGYSRNQYGAGSTYVNMDEYGASMMVLQSGEACVRTHPCQIGRNSPLSAITGRPKGAPVDDAVPTTDDYDTVTVPIVFESYMLDWMIRWLKMYYPEAIDERGAAAREGFVQCKPVPLRKQPYRVLGTTPGISTALLTLDQVGGYVTRFGRPAAEQAVEVLARATGCTPPLRLRRRPARGASKDEL